MITSCIFAVICVYKTFEGTLDIQRQLIADYKEDIRKYAEAEQVSKIIEDALNGSKMMKLKMICGRIKTCLCTRALCSNC